MHRVRKNLYTKGTRNTMQSCGLCLVLDGILATNGCRTNQINVHDYDIFLPFHVCFFYCILCIGSRSI